MRKAEADMSGKHTPGQWAAPETAAERDDLALELTRALADRETAEAECDRLRAENAELVAVLEPFVADGHCPTCNNAGDCAGDGDERQPNCAWERARAVLAKAAATEDGE